MDLVYPNMSASCSDLSIPYSIYYYVYIKSLYCYYHEHDDDYYYYDWNKRCTASIKQTRITLIK